VTETGITLLALLATIGQGVLILLLAAAALRVVGVNGPWDFIRASLVDTELWLAFTVAVVATTGSLFLSEVADFIPCKLCWFQRIAMYPLVLLALPAFALDRRAARYFLPLPVVGLGVSIYHLLVERGVISETQSCQISAPGGCGVRWMEEFGYVTIPVLAATGFALCIFLLAFAFTGEREAT
jgi:disulfide bond formation protein DsbB